MTRRLVYGKNRFSELFSRALSEGPQRVRRHNRAVIVIAEQDFEKLTGEHPSFKEFLLGAGPSLKGVDVSRDSSSMRHVKL